MDIRLTFSDMGTVASVGMPALVLQESWGRYPIEVRNGIHCRFDRQRTNHRHRHLGYHELCLVTAGTGRYVHDRESIDLGRGLAFRAAPGVSHEIISPRGDLELVFLAFRVGPVAEVPDGATYTEAAVTAFLAGARLASPARHLLPLLEAFAVHGPDPARTWAAESVLRAFTVALLAALTQQPVPGPVMAAGLGDAVDRACRIIDQHLAQPLAVATIAAQVGVGERQLRRLFAARLGHGIVQECRRRRLNAAAQHLLLDHSASATAAACGFASAAVFTRAFKMRFGMSPSAYRRQHAQTVVPMIEHTPPEALSADRWP
jgi:AraC-like DNA-binding protein/mannose-6-phosphate isomerase-like protein (cupin superfamily)